MRHALASVALLVASLLSVRPAIADAPVPLTDKQKSIMYGSAEDVLDKQACATTPEHQRVAGLKCKDSMHYVHANEWTHQVWKPYVAGIGGAYVGVATDQGFTLMAWARSEIGFLMDYDPVVVRVNHVHRALIEHSPDIATYVARYATKGKTEALAILEAEYAGHPDRAGILAAYRDYRGTIASYYAKIVRRAKYKNHFLHDPADYEYVRQLCASDRIRVMKGDLLKDKSMRGIARITHDLGIPMRVVYMSNAEEFWPYPKAFRENYAAMHMDEKSVILRTRHTDIYGPRIDGYVYIVQDGVDFRTKLPDRKYNGVWTMMLDRKPAAEREGLFTIGPVELVAPAPISKR